MPKDGDFSQGPRNYRTVIKGEGQFSKNYIEEILIEGGSNINELQEIRFSDQKTSARSDAAKISVDFIKKQPIECAVVEVEPGKYEVVKKEIVGLPGEGPKGVFIPGGKYAFQPYIDFLAITGYRDTEEYMAAVQKAVEEEQDVADMDDLLSRLEKREDLGFCLKIDPLEAVRNRDSSPLSIDDSLRRSLDESLTLFTKSNPIPRRQYDPTKIASQKGKISRDRTDIPNPEK